VNQTIFRIFDPPRGRTKRDIAAHHNRGHGGIISLHHRIVSTASPPSDIEAMPHRTQSKGEAVVVRNLLKKM